MIASRRRKRVRRIFRHWIDFSAFENSERLFREVRDGERRLLMRVFLEWRMRVRATVLTKLTYRDLHDDRFIQEFKDEVDVNLSNASA